MVIILLLLKDCKPVGKINTSKIDTVTVMKSDTIYPKPDTIEIPITRLRIVKSIPDTVHTEVCKLIRIYQDSLVDSNIAFYYTDVVKGMILDKHMSYKLKVPLRITDSVFVTTTKTETINKQPKVTLFAGISVGGNKNTFNSAGPFVSLQLKNNLIGYNYNALQNTHNISFGVKLSQTRK